MSTGVVAESMEVAINEIAGVLNAQHAALVEHVIELLADPREWQGEGVWTMESWLMWRLGCGRATADALVVVARRATDLPQCLAAFVRGELSLDSIATIARKAPWWADEQSVTFGRNMTIGQLRHVMGKYPFPNLDKEGREVREELVADGTAREAERVDTTDLSDAVAAVAKRDAAVAEPASTCSFYVGDDGRFRLHAETDYETGQIISRALEEARDRLFQAGQADVDWVDALSELANRSADTVVDPARRARFKTAMFIDVNATMTDTSGWNIPDAIRQHLTCDGTVSPVFVDSGVPVSVGRAQHIVPVRTRTIIEHRDHGVCRVPGCTQRHGLEVHHIVHWECDGVTDTWNLVLICGKHHRQHHRGRLGITGNADDPDGLVFTNRHGQPIPLSGAKPKPPDGLPPKPASTFQHPLGERLDTKWIYFNPPEVHRHELLERVQARNGTASDFLDSFRANPN